MSEKLNNCWTKANIQLKEWWSALVFCSLFLWRNWWSIFFVFIKFCPFPSAASDDQRNTILKLFLSNDGVDVDLARNWTSLHWAINRRVNNNTTTLLRHGASINSRNCYILTPIQQAQRLGRNIPKLYRQCMRIRKFLKDFYFIFIFPFWLEMQRAFVTIVQKERIYFVVFLQKTKFLSK